MIAGPAKRKPVEHREPTPGTVRQLYGTAFACGKPGCDADLYVMDEESGRRVLNSRVAHIHARREHGPRWNPDMSEADNRDANNLLLLCLLHAWEVDDVPEQYPAKLLRDWKQAQLADYAKARKGWKITDAEASEAVTPLDLRTAIDAIANVVPFNPRMRSRVEAWQLAVRNGHARRVARLAPLVPSARRDAVLAWMATLNDPIVDVPPGQVRVLVGRLGSGKSEQAARWWEQGLQAAANDPDTEIPLYFTPRHIIASLEQAVVAELGSDPIRTCRVVIDDLDSVPAQKADCLLTEARQLVQVWPKVSVLATARREIAVPAEEKIDLAPWPVRRGLDLAEVVSDYVPSRLRTKEMTSLLTTPLTVLALAARVLTGWDTKVSRAHLLSELVPMLIESRHIDVSEDTWQDFAQLAVALLDEPESATTAMFRPLPRLHRLVATDLVVQDGSTLAFALPVLEQYFGAEAIRTGQVSLEAAAAANTFPRWRYALAFAVSTADAPEQEALLINMAKINPAATFWVLDEVADTDAHAALHAPSDGVIDALIRRRTSTGLATEPDLAIRAGLWLREAELALLSGLGPLAESLTRHRGGKLVQWGVRLQRGHFTLARARNTTPPPDVIKLSEDDHRRRSKWHRWTQFPFPTTEFGRWLRAQSDLQRRLQKAIDRRALPVPRTSMLARERAYLLASFVQDFGTTRSVRPIRLAQLRQTVSAWMQQVDTSQRSTWQSGARTVDPDDIRWLAHQLTMENDDTIQPPWPECSRRHVGGSAQQARSSELTLTLTTAIVREALIGYRQLVELNFPAFGRAMGLYSMFPLRVEGLVGKFDDEKTDIVEMFLVLHSDPTQPGPDHPTIDLRLVTDDHLQTFGKFRDAHRRTVWTPFGQNPLQGFEMPLNTDCPATDIAYRWLAHDLAAVGWLKDSAWP